MKTKIALCVGHSRTIGKSVDGGATSWDNHTNELEFNRILAQKIQQSLLSLGIESLIFDRYQGVGYGQAITWLASAIKQAGCTEAVELHFNSAGPLAHGHEVLYWQGSTRGKLLAQYVEGSLSSHFQTPARGAKGLGRGDRGVEFTLRTHCPAIITEPLFGSSREDWEAVASKPGLLGECIAIGISNYLKHV